MSRILTFGLLASTMLVASPVLAQERNSNRGEWIRNQNQQSTPRAERQRDWSGGRQGEARQQRQVERREQPRPQVRQAAPERQTQPSAVQTTRVPRSEAPRADWQERRGQSQNWQERRAENQPNRDRANREQPRSWNDSNRNNAQWQRNEQVRRDAERQVQENRRREEQARNDRNRQDWRDRDNRAGNDRRWDGRRDNDWQRNDRARNDNNWNRQRDWNYQRRLNERERWSDQRRWDNRWRNDRRYDWNRYRTQYRHIYRMPAYSAPYGWNYGYRRFSLGIYLSNVLFSSSYWINDPYYYRLPPVYGSLRWVRYYDDALLVDVRDGYVVDVIHDFFW